MIALKAAMEAHVAGIESADYEIVEVGHDVEALKSLFAGAEAVCNSIGRLANLGPRRIAASRRSANS